MTMTGNLLILFLALTDSQLHTPMYFFLGNLAFIDLSYSSVTTPRMLYDLFNVSRIISIPACTTQVFFFIYFASAELFLLGVMSYDRYIAVCHPLHYLNIMSWKICTQLVSVVWFLSLLYSLVHILNSLMLTYCGPNTIQNFFCDLPHLIQLSCSDTFINVVIEFIAGGVLGICVFALTSVPYVHIFRAVFKIRIKEGKLKAISTCSSHLMVVFIFYSSIVFIYFIPTRRYLSTLNKLVNVIYAVINPLLNPLIYSLRNRDLKVAIRRTFHRTGST
ncbi:olfactory receptor 5AR1-like [Discoglossus pictus]